MHFLGVRFLPALPFCFDQWQLLTHCDVYAGDHACFSEHSAGKVGATTLGSLYLPPAERSSILQVINRYHDYYSLRIAAWWLFRDVFKLLWGDSKAGADTA